jgi:hypothetical protein
MLRQQQVLCGAGGKRSNVSVWLVGCALSLRYPTGGARHSGGPSKGRCFLAQRLIVDDERWLGREGMGEFLKRGESGRL